MCCAIPHNRDRKILPRLWHENPEARTRLELWLKGICAPRRNIHPEQFREEQMTCAVDLPWPPEQLSPNYRKGWAAKHNPKVKYRSDCYLIAKAQNVSLRTTSNVPLLITFHTKTKTRPDLDNCLSWIKHGLDSVASAWGINDRQFHPITIQYGEPVKGGRVRICVNS